MKISTKGRYAVRVMLDLARHHNGEYVKLKSVAMRQGVSEKYLEQIIAVLSRAGFVKSVRGAQGGYKLAGDPSSFTVGMVLRAAEGSLAPVACMDGAGDEIDCERAGTCETLPLWKKLKKAIDDVVDNVTIADLLTESKENAQGEGNGIRI